MPSPAPRSPYLLPLLLAALLPGAALLVLSVVASRALTARDAAVREGVLLSLGHELEGALREAGPGGARQVLEAACTERGGEVAGLELAGPSGALFSCGSTGGDAVVLPVALGREWRGLGGGMGGGMGGGPGQGPFGPGPGGPRMRLSLSPAESLGRSRLLPRLLVLGAGASAAGLLVLAVLAARGLAERQRRLALEAERQRLDAVALAGAGLAHRIRNPLGAIKGTAQLLASATSGPERERASRIVEASERIERLVSRLLAFARPPEAQPERLDLSALAAAVVPPYAPVRLVAPAPVEADADREHVTSVLEELLANARAFDPEGELLVGVHREGERAVVEVADRGPGLSVEAEKAFDPYVTTRADGTGLGLPIVRSLARAGNGDVRLAPREGGGCVALLHLPAAGKG